MSAAPNPKVTIDQLLLRSIYYRFQAFIAPVITLIVCVFLFLFLVIPQIQAWFAMRDSLTADAQDLSVMQQNLTLVSSFNTDKLNETLATATNALPTDKDFANIISSLQNAAAIAGTSLGDYSFQLGDLSGQDQNGRAAQLPLQLSVTLKGSMTDAQRFVTQLGRQLPLSDSIAVSVGNNASITVTVVFYYSSLPKIIFQDNKPLPLISKADQTLLDTLKNNNNLGTTILATPSGTLAPTVTPTATPTPRATPTFTPTVSPTSAATTSAR